MQLGYVFDITSGTAYVETESSWKHGYGARLRRISPQLFVALAEGTVTSGDVTAFYMEAARSGNPNADADILLGKPLDEIKNAEIKAAPAVPTPTEEELAQDQAEAIKKAGEETSEGTGEEQKPVNGNETPEEAAFAEFERKKYNPAKLSYNNLVLVAQRLGVDTDKVKKVKDLHAAIIAKMDSRKCTRSR